MTDTIKVKETKQKGFRPENLRTILAFLLFLLVVGGGGVFYLRLNTLKTYATEVNQTLADANAKEKQISDLQVLRNRLLQSTELVAKADAMFSTPDTYQAQMLNDVRKYADVSNITIASTSFENGSTYTMVVRLLSPVSYDSLLLFLTNIETNLPKLRITSLDIGHQTDGKSGTVRVGDIKIEASVR